MPSAILFYDVVLFVHVAAVVLAFGVTFAYPVFLPWAAKHHPREMPVLHEIQGRIGKLLITPAATVALLAGAYLASDRDYWGEIWVVVPLVILLLLLGLGGAYFAPQERRITEMARRDMAAGDAYSDEYRALVGRVSAVGAASSLLVLVAIFFMTVKPG